MKRTLLIILACLFTTLSVTSVYADETAFLAQSDAQNVNVRAGNDIKFEVITQLDKYQKVMVLSKSGDWYKIELPSHTPVFVNRQFVKRQDDLGSVTEDDVNIRSGPDMNYSIIAKAKASDILKIIKEENDWYAVEPTKECFGWVKSEYLKFNVSLKDYNDLTQRIARLEKSFNSEISKPPADMDFDAMLSDYEDIAAKFPDTDFAKSAMAMVEKIKLVKSLDIKALEAALPKGPSSPPVAIGILEDLGMILRRPGTHKLVYNDKLIYYLKSSQVDLNKYAKLKVQIWGNISNPSHLDQPLIEVAYVSLAKE